MVDRNLNHHVVVTAIVVRNGKYLIAKRADWEKAFPGRWTVPGGKVEVLDYALREKDTPHHWYNVLEDAVKREAMEEVGLEIGSLGYVTSLVYLKKGNVPCLIISLYADANEGEVRLCNELTEFAWVDLVEAKNYDLIEGVYEELKIVDGKLNGDEELKWNSKKS
ncbi:NUDIX domain-containing protein [Candidatus Pacearchaeota archaeon]|nr:NUDIX domain-containing protein [Candidatus Pacearchaeota archaeon]